MMHVHVYSYCACVYIDRVNFNTRSLAHNTDIFLHRWNGKERKVYENIDSSFDQADSIELDYITNFR